MTQKGAAAMAEHSATLDLEQGAFGQDDSRASPSASTGLGSTGSGIPDLRSLRRSPLGHLTEAITAGEVKGERAVRLRELPFLTMIGLRAEPGSATASAFEGILGILGIRRHPRLPPSGAVQPGRGRRRRRR
ncbi:hypothetical protein [Arthrobacter sp. Br18]|uniref:hypothetical protein n=1 Tax=Arthrobacter sp. Br18 TaxID=1312954 RepID=UPI0004AC7DED|nr:hypothetical protein [Arthrobacter sp. Br18]